VLTEGLFMMTPRSDSRRDIDTTARRRTGTFEASVVMIAREHLRSVGSGAGVVEEDDTVVPVAGRVEAADPQQLFDHTPAVTAS
jgi:hypothetical protein